MCARKSRTSASYRSEGCASAFSRGGAIVAMRTTSPAALRSLPRLHKLLQHHQPDQRLGVLAAGDRAVELAQRDLDDLDPLVGRGTAGHVVELSGEEEPDALVRETRARVEALQLAPVPGRLADLLDQLALGALELSLPRNVELPRRKLEERGLLDSLPGLLDHVEDAAVVGDDADRAGVNHDLPDRPAAVRVLERLHAHRGDRPAVDQLAPHLLQPLVAHRTLSVSEAAARASPA